MGSMLIALPFHTSYRGPSLYVTAMTLNGQSCVTEDWLQQMLEEHRYDIFQRVSEWYDVHGSRQRKKS